MTLRHVSKLRKGGEPSNGEFAVCVADQRFYDTRNFLCGPGLDDGPWLKLCCEGPVRCNTNVVTCVSWDVNNITEPSSLQAGNGGIHDKNWVVLGKLCKRGSRSNCTIWVHPEGNYQRLLIPHICNPSLARVCGDQRRTPQIQLRIQPRRPSKDLGS